MYNCPKCDRDFDSKNGFSTHYSIKHEGPLPTRNKFECEWCNSDFYVSDSEAERNPKYCNYDCKMEALHNSNSGENHHNWNEDKSTECEICGEKFRPKNKTGRFCSNECKAKWMESAFSGKENPNYKSSKSTKSCIQCNSDFTTYESINKSFCSNDCRGEYYSGSNHPQWVDGYEDWYGNNWESVRLEVIERDNFTCQSCNKKLSDCEERLHVHHIRPLRTYDEDEIEEKANDKSNLITLCRSCHPKWESISRRLFK